MIRLIRTFIGYVFVAIGAFILPKEAKDYAEVDDEPGPETPLAKKDDNSLRVQFTDLTSYVEALKEPIDQKSGAISICNDLKKISEQKQSPVRLQITISSKYNGAGEMGGSCIASIGGYSKGRWYKLRDLEMSADSVPGLVTEFIEAMAQEGWSCVNDASEQILDYLLSSAQSSSEYLIGQCKQRNTTGTVRVSIGLQTDVTKDAGKEVGVIPRIIARVSTALAGRSPNDTSHTVYFARKKIAAKPLA